ncbi:phosphatase PAP2 family protein [Legionella israelensis]|uniref:PAP2 superfamily protein n=1 Tax=Legionella israelensis TaxID=454 RepID=A0A0W0WGP8_9GAMM|nr:phosphatase PAP2 family protein [Legionella israelensis]KTD31517.1 PAP2 superfamily protein [Legionella israelensis]QBR83148.1 phosphatase PAP2 family protein [Legionella israelensis]QBS09476.1 phosphatase PAP2 family protein [Legionella israelensis]SCX96231.1 undecaprenyl-diphosphatase [Legionella israelensis DSM 19235]STX60384.1 PAP2 superfamily [Legionella israelensis]
MFADYLADFFLTFSQLTAICFISLTGFLFINRKLFFQAASLGAFDIIVNVALKGTFKVPLPVEIGSGYAFPSGHMQFATVFYLWLILSYSFWPFRVITAILLTGIGAGLIHYGYHNLYEVSGGLFFGILLIAFYRYLLKKFHAHTLRLLLMVACFLMLYNAFIYTLIPSHAWSAFYVLWGLLIVEQIRLKFEPLSS